MAPPHLCIAPPLHSPILPLHSPEDPRWSQRPVSPPQSQSLGSGPRHPLLRCFFHNIVSIKTVFSSVTTLTTSVLNLCIQMLVPVTSVTASVLEAVTGGHLSGTPSDVPGPLSEEQEPGSLPSVLARADMSVAPMRGEDSRGWRVLGVSCSALHTPEGPMGVPAAVISEAW